VYKEVSVLELEKIPELNFTEEESQMEFQPDSQK